MSGQCRTYSWSETAVEVEMTTAASPAAAPSGDSFSRRRGAATEALESPDPTVLQVVEG